jgi:hypothetical protein
MEAFELNKIAKGLKLQQEGHLREAEVAYRDALKLNPSNADALHLLGTLAFQVGKYEIAVQFIQRALKISPTSAHFYNNCGPALRALGRFEEAINCYRKAMELQPSLPQVWYNLGKCYGEAGEILNALDAYNRQLELGGDQASTRWNRSLINLVLGNYQDGWRDYELRWQATPAAVGRRNFAIPAWTGEPLRGKTLFIYAEQGLGDTIQFIRYAPLVVERGGRVIVECQPELVRLIQSMPSIEKVILQGSPMPPCDFQIAMMSLPLAFQTRLETIPSNTPYLFPDNQETLVWKQRLGFDKAKRNIGLVWAGGRKHPGDARRSLNLEQLAPLAQISGIHWISLQKGEPANQASASSLSLSDWTAELDDMNSTASLIMALDGVVAVDTAVAHLAGALGKPAWLLLPFVSDFRWLLNRQDSPWYPNMRIVRQSVLGDWAGAIKKLDSILKDGV